MVAQSWKREVQVHRFSTRARTTLPPLFPFLTQPKRRWADEGSPAPIREILLSRSVSESSGLQAFPTKQGGLSGRKQPPASASNPLKSPHCKFTMQQMPSYHPIWAAQALHHANQQIGLWSPSQGTLAAVPTLAGTVCQGCVCLSVCYARLQEVAGRLQLPAFSRVRPAEHTSILLRAPTPGFTLLTFQPKSGAEHP